MKIFKSFKKKLFVVFSIFFVCNLNARICNKNTPALLSEVSKKNFFYNKQKSIQGKIYVPYDHPLVTKFRNQYLNESGFLYLQTIMQRSKKYRAYIVEEIRKANVPVELIFLPVIESGYYLKAASKSGAVGIWQFMKNSIGGYNIHINEWIDERRDPWKTTDAAIKKLKWNYSYYNDWCLALAAYNCGVGGLDRAIKKAKSKNYWYLVENGYLKKETAFYVAKFLAISQILMQSKKYGIDWGEAWETSRTETIAINRSVDLILLAEKLNIKKEILLDLNPALKFNITPPNMNYNLRLLEGHKDTFASILKQNTLLIRYYAYTVKSGDTLYALAKHYGVSVKSILNYNPKVTPKTLKIGRKLLIPALKSVNAYHTVKKENNLKFNGTYKIQKGDTLWSIALKYNIQVELLAEKNSLTVNSILSLGKTLKVPIQE